MSGDGGGTGYSPEVVRRFEDPDIIRADLSGPGVLIRGESGSVAQGTWVVIRARVDGGAIREVAVDVFGCPHTIAACSLLAERLRGQPVEALASIREQSLREDLDIPAGKAGRLLVIEDALRNGLTDWDNAPLRPRMATQERS